MISLTTVRTEMAPEERAQATFEVAGGDFGGKLMVTRRTGRAVRAALEEALTGLPRGGAGAGHVGGGGRRRRGQADGHATDGPGGPGGAGGGFDGSPQGWDVVRG